MSSLAGAMDLMSDVSETDITDFLKTVGLDKLLLAQPVPMNRGLKAFLQLRCPKNLLGILETFLSTQTMYGAKYVAAAVISRAILVMGGTLRGKAAANMEANKVEADELIRLSILNSKDWNGAVTSTIQVTNCVGSPYTAALPTTYLKSIPVGWQNLTLVQKTTGTTLTPEQKAKNIAAYNSAPKLAEAPLPKAEAASSSSNGTGGSSTTGGKSTTLQRGVPIPAGWAGLSSIDRNQLAPEGQALFDFLAGTGSDTEYIKQVKLINPKTKGAVDILGMWNFIGI
jgi:hypothetical protein